MTAETQVHQQVPAVSTNPKASADISGDQCARDVSNYQGSSKLPLPDCSSNGISHPENSGIGRDDAEENSYVFVSGCDDLISLDNDVKGNTRAPDASGGVEVQKGKSFNFSASGGDTSWIFEGSEAASSDNCSAEKSAACDLQIADTDILVHQNGRVGTVDLCGQLPENQQIDCNSSLPTEENRELGVGVLVSAACSVGNVHPNTLDINESFDNNSKSQENSSHSTCDVRDGEESQHAGSEATPCRSSEVGTFELGADSVRNHEPVILLDTAESIDVNSEFQKGNVGSSSELRECKEVQHGNLEATPSRSSQSEDYGSGTDSVGNCAPEFAIQVDSINVNKKSQDKNLESKSGLGEDQELQNDGLEATFDGSSEAKISNMNEVQQHSESSDQSVGIQDSRNMRSDIDTHALLQTEVQKVEEQPNTESAGRNADSVGNSEPEIAFDVVESTNVNNKSWEENLESICESGEGRGSQNTGLEVTYSGQSEVKASKGNNAQQNSKSSDELSGTQESRNMLSAGCASLVPEVQKIEEQSDTKLTSTNADSVGNPEAEVAVEFESTDVNNKSWEENLESKCESGEGRGSQDTGLEVTYSGQSEVKDSKGNDAQQNSESSDELGGTQDSRNMHSDSAGYASVETEVQKVEGLPDTESTSTNADSVGYPEAEVAVGFESTDVNNKSWEENLESKCESEEGRVSQNVGLEVTYSGPSEVKASMANDAQQNSVSSDESGGTQDSQNMHSGSAGYASLETEVQKVEGQPDTESTSTNADSVGNSVADVAVDVESTDVNNKSWEENLESKCESGEGRGSRNVGLEVTSSGPSEVKASKGNDAQQNSESPDELGGSQDSLHMHSDSAGHASVETEVQKIEEQPDTGLTNTNADSVGRPEAEVAVNFESIDVNKKAREENLESKSVVVGEDIKSQSAGLEVALSGSSEVEVSKGNESQQNSESSDESQWTQNSCDMHSDSAGHASVETEVQKIEEQPDTGLTNTNADSVGKREAEVAVNFESIDVNKKAREENLESKSVVVGEDNKSQSAGLEVALSGSSEVEVSKGNESQQNSESSDESQWTQNSCDMHSDSAGHASVETEVQKIEEQPDTGLTNTNADSVGKPEAEVAVNFESIDVNKKAREENLESKSVVVGEDIKSRSAGMEVALSGSSEVEVSNGNESQQNSESSDESRWTQNSCDMHSDSAGHASLRAEEQSDLVSTGLCPVIMTEQSESCTRSNADTDGQKLEEQTSGQLHLNAKKINKTGTVVSESVECVMNRGHKTDRSANEVLLPLDPNENKLLVSPVNGSVPETKEKSIEHKDDTENPLELQQSSETTDNLNASDSRNGLRQTKSHENVLDIAREQEDKNKSSPSTQNVATNTHEIVKPESGNAENIANESAFDLTRDCGREQVPLCLTENDAATAKELIEQETDTENPGDSVSPVRYLKFKTRTVKDANGTSIAEGDSTCCSTKLIVVEEIGFKTPDPEEVAAFQGAIVHLETEVSTVEEECSDLLPLPSETEKEVKEVGSCSIISSGDIPCSDVSIGNDVSESYVTNEKPSEDKSECLSSADLNSEDKLIGPEAKDVQNTLNNGNSSSLAENSSAGTVAGQDVIVEPLTRPFHFLIRMPRYEDLKMKEHIRKAQLLVEEKTRHRDAFRIEVQKHKANCLGYAAEYEAATAESRALKRSVKAKRAEIDSLQSVINKVKNAISVEDIDTRIHSMEHMIEHETLPLKEEKQLIREIKQLKQLREQLSSNIGSQDEVQQALNNRDQIEECLKVLKKELDSLKDSVFKADAVARALEKKYEDENKKVKEVQTQYSAANNVRQDAYAHLQSLKKQLYEKNQQFRMYKDNAAAAANFAAKRERKTLHHLCVNQVESIMGLWNKNDEFRRDYIRCNMKSTLRRLGTADGRSLGPDERPPVLTSFGEERVDRLVSNPLNSDIILQTQNPEQDSASVQDITVGDKIEAKQSEQKSLTTGPRKQERPVLRNSLATVSGNKITDENREEQNMLAEELELVRKAEELRKQEDEAKLKEQRRLEERVKALEASERKKRNAEKAQMRAELRAQKEAEQREKEREKRLRKKERKKGTASEVSDGNNLVESTANSESLTETFKESETKENPSAVSKRPQKPSQFTKQSKAKSIPPPLRNRGRRRIQQWMWVILTCLLVVALFLLGNVGFFSNLSNLRRRNTGF